jgi:chromosome segregation ATPase
VEDLKEKAELLQQLQAERSRAENEVRKLQLTASQVTLDISKAQCELASTKVYISELHTETQSLIREVTSLWNDLAKHRLSESYSTSIRMAYQSKMKLYDVEHSNFVSKTISASELRDLQQEIADLEAQLQTLKGQGDVQDLRKQLQELETRHQVVSADREAWSKKIDELTSEKMNVLQSIQQLKVMCTYYSYSNQFCLNIKPCISLLCLMIM